MIVTLIDSLTSLNDSVLHDVVSGEKERREREVGEILKRQKLGLGNGRKMGKGANGGEKAKEEHESIYYHHTILLHTLHQTRTKS